MLIFREQGIPVKTAVNVSVKNLLSEDAVRTIKNTVKEAGIAPENVTLEIVETEMLSSSAVTKERLSKLKAEGFTIAIDDFGKGYSSLSYLSEYPVDAIKIDNSFSCKLGQDPNSGKIVKTLIDLAHQLKLSVVCEGVEDEKTVEMVRNLGADFAQGYYYAKPIQGKDVLSWYRSYLEGETKQG